MLPLKDDIPSRRFPVVTVGILLLNSLAFFYELSLAEGLESAVLNLGIVPIR